MSHAAFNIVPSDTVNLPGATVGGIYVGGAGNVTVVPLAGGPSVVFTAVAAGTLLPIIATRVMATGTSATLMVGLPASAIGRG